MKEQTGCSISTLVYGAEDRELCQTLTADASIVTLVSCGMRSDDHYIIVL